MEAEHGGKADGHVGIAAEVKVQLEAVEHHAEDGGEGAHPRHAGYGGERRAEGVRQKDLLHEAGKEHRHAAPGVGDIDGPVVKLRLHVLVPDDGAGHDLGEEADVQGKRQRVSLRLGFAAVHVKDIGQRREREKRDAERQRQRLCGDVRAEDGVHVFDEKARVFKVAQDE